MTSPRVQVLPPQAGGLLPVNIAIPGLQAVNLTAAAPVSGDTTASNISGGPGWAEAETNDKSLVAYIVGWGIFLLMIVLLNRTRAGHAIIYYLLVLALILLLVVNYQAITDLVAPVVGGPETSGPVESGASSNGPSAENYNVDVLPAVQAGSTIQITSGGISAPRFSVS